MQRHVDIQILSMYVCSFPLTIVAIIALFLLHLADIQIANAPNLKTLINIFVDSKSMAFLHIYYFGRV